MEYYTLIIKLPSANGTGSRDIENPNTFSSASTSPYISIPNPLVANHANIEEVHWIEAEEPTLSRHELWFEH
jgi:hypothetical protein